MINNNNIIEKKPNLVDFNCKNHINGESGTITYNNGEKKSYTKIFCLDNKIDLTEVYKILHDKDNFGSNVAFILNSDLDFSKTKDYSELNNNLNLTKYKPLQNTFLPIGGIYNYYNNNDNTAGGEDGFNASFYGNNHKITVGDINYSDEDNVGFFGFIWSDGKVYDLNLKIGNVSGSGSVGGFVGHNYGTIEKSSVVVNSVRGSGKNVGGFVGYNNNYNRKDKEYKGTISNSSAIVNTISGKKYVGGFVGGNIGTIENSSVVVDSVIGISDVGGFVGLNIGKIENSSAVVNSVRGSYDIGGFVGGNYYGTIEKSSVVVNSVRGSGKNVGGFVGKNEGTIENSSIVVNSVRGRYFVGGFVGGNGGTIENSSIVVNSVRGKNEVGVFVGYNHYGKIANSSVVVDSVIGISDVGGFVGGNDGTILNSVARVLVLDGNSNDVSAGYYTNKNLDGNLIKINKQEFFFGDNLNNSKNKSLSYDGTNLKITVPAEKIFNKSDFPSAFSTDNDNWGYTIMSNLSNYWDTNGWD